MPAAIVKYPVKTVISGNAVNYRGTDVVTYNADGSITLRTGGWKTATTKHRMNQYGRGVHVYQQKGGWFVVWQGLIYNYYDGMTLYADGRVIEQDGGVISVNHHAMKSF